MYLYTHFSQKLQFTVKDVGTDKLLITSICSFSPRGHVQKQLFITSLPSVSPPALRVRVEKK